MKNIHIGYSDDDIIDSIHGEYAMYLRKSRADMEAEARGEGETLARHKKMLMELARRCNYKIGKIYHEVVSGESIEARPEAQKMLEDVSEGRWKGVLVVEVERLARGDTMDQGRVAKCFKFSSTKIITPMKIYDPTNEYDEEYFEFGLFMSRREYKVINRRLQNGRLASVGEGKYVGSISPYGYDRVKLKDQKGYTLERNDEANIVEQIYDMYAYGGLSINEIAKQLNAFGLKNRHEKLFTKETIRGILSNPVYVGMIRWNARKVVQVYKNGKILKTRPRNPNHKLVKGLHKEIIDKQTWDIVQAKLDKHAPAVPHNDTVQNPLMGIVYCSKCGRKMQRRPYKAKGWDDFLLCPNDNCDNISSKLYIVENKIIDSLKEWLKEYKIDCESYLEDIKSKRKLNYEENLKKLKLDLNLQNKKLMNVYDYFEDGIYTREKFAERCLAINENITKINDNIKEFERLIEEEVRKETGKKAIIPKVENVLDLYPKLKTSEEKNDLLKTVVKRVEYLKTERAIKKDSDPTNFELDIYPNIG